MVPSPLCGDFVVFFVLWLSGVLGVTFGSIGGLLDAFGAPSGDLWASFGASGTHLGDFEGLLGAFGGLFARLWMTPGSFWAHLGAFGCFWGSFWEPLSASGSLMDTFGCFRHASWPYLGTLGCLWVFLAVFGGAFG